MDEQQQKEFRYATRVRAIDPNAGELSTFRGIDIYAFNMDEAQEWIDNNAGYFEVIGHYDEAGEVVYLEKAIAA